ncbi:unnamed protein product [Amoebophrya sp. A120]|nr:unnamed protein product [Amoebophrya sp. A120]|eukprot:GSA120T00023666001.1
MQLRIIECDTIVEPVLEVFLKIQVQQQDDGFSHHVSKRLRSLQVLHDQLTSTSTANIHQPAFTQIPEFPSSIAVENLARDELFCVDVLNTYLRKLAAAEVFHAERCFREFFQLTENYVSEVATSVPPPPGGATATSSNVGTSNEDLLQGQTGGSAAAPGATRPQTTPSLVQQGAFSFQHHQQWNENNNQLEFSQHHPTTQRLVNSSTSLPNSEVTVFQNPSSDTFLSSFLFRNDAPVPKRLCSPEQGARSVLHPRPVGHSSTTTSSSSTLPSSATTGSIPVDSAHAALAGTEPNYTFVHNDFPFPTTSSSSTVPAPGPGLSSVPYPPRSWMNQNGRSASITSTGNYGISTATVGRNKYLLGAPGSTASSSRRPAGLGPASSSASAAGSIAQRYFESHANKSTPATSSSSSASVININEPEAATGSNRTVATGASSSPIAGQHFSPGAASAHLGPASSPGGGSNYVFPSSTSNSSRSFALSNHDRQNLIPVLEDEVAPGVSIAPVPILLAPAAAAAAASNVQLLDAKNLNVLFPPSTAAYLGRYEKNGGFGDGGTISAASNSSAQWMSGPVYDEFGLRRTVGTLFGGSSNSIVGGPRRQVNDVDVGIYNGAGAQGDEDQAAFSAIAAGRGTPTLVVAGNQNPQHFLSGQGASRSASSYDPAAAYYPQRHLSGDAGSTRQGGHTSTSGYSTGGDTISRVLVETAATAQAAHPHAQPPQKGFGDVSMGGAPLQPPEQGAIVLVQESNNDAADSLPNTLEAGTSSPKRGPSKESSSLGLTVGSVDRKSSRGAAREDQTTGGMTAAPGTVAEEALPEDVADIDRGRQVEDSPDPGEPGGLQLHAEAEPEAQPALDQTQQESLPLQPHPPPPVHGPTRSKTNSEKSAASPQEQSLRRAPADHGAPQKQQAITPNRYLIRPTQSKQQENAIPTLDQLHGGTTINGNGPVSASDSASFDQQELHGSPLTATALQPGQAGPCVICLSQPQSHAAMPCGHLCLCSRCYPVLKSCPICRRPVENFARIYRA